MEKDSFLYLDRNIKKNKKDRNIKHYKAVRTP